jgi:methyl-accepting chemotaxis protein
MHRKLNVSIRVKLIAVLVISVMLSVAGITALLIYRQSNSMLDQMKIDGENIARTFAITVQNMTKISDDKATAQKVTEEVGKSQGLEYAALISKDYIDICDSQKDDIGKKYDDDETKQVVLNKKTSFDLWKQDGGKTVLDVQVPVDITIAGEKISAVDIGLSLDEMNKGIMSSTLWGVLFAFVFIAVFSILPGILIKRFIIDPLNGVNNQLKAMSDGDFSIEVPKKYLKSKDEMGEIARSLSAMQKSIGDIIRGVVHEAWTVDNSVQEITKNNKFLVVVR